MPICTDVGRLQLLHSLLPGSRSVEGGRGPFASSNHRRVTGQADVLVQFVGLKWNQQNDVMLGGHWI